MSLTEFEALITYSFIICIMLYSNSKYQRNYYFQGFWLIMISIIGVSFLSINVFYILTLMIFNLLLNISYISFNQLGSKK